MHMSAPLMRSAVVLALLCCEAHAAAVLSEAQARAKAIAILKGDPYGNSAKEISDNLKEVQLIAAGVDACSKNRVRGPVWQFHIVVPKEKMKDGNSPIDGYLVLDGRSGKMLCAGLPFLD
jgi:hypothetical protein